uniref:Uncharacterized protein n=1 Tax=Timema tahoe TaxID=61484 RepID=A0A7R9IP18_9NEOP|nr:unnamed protein product [Timema tahoe]
MLGIELGALNSVERDKLPTEPRCWTNHESLHNFTMPFLDELDWPEYGFITGFMNTTKPLLIKVSLLCW